ncbi:MAG: riboflavin synthase [Chlorobi bacterium]|nr:riboflavin synthase [Chlorobiota bacterium]MCI0716886.1 riboflavin synthase [Chlorobiota bacterium]
MFTGIIEEIGKITLKKKVSEGYRFRVKSKTVAKALAKSDSVCINGVCHTVSSKSKSEFEFTSVHETLKKTNIGKLRAGDEVNLESSLTPTKKMGGHFVFGHIDDTGIISSTKQIKRNDSKKSDNWEYRIKINKKHYSFVIYVGSIAVNGVSLTVAEVKKPKGNFFEIMVAIIPYTYNYTTFRNLKVNQSVNLEFDFLGKYVLNILSQNPRLKKLIKP